MRVFRIVLVFHQTWFSLFTFFPSLGALMPTLPGSQNVHLFQIRPDFDTALSSVLLALLLFDFLSGKNSIKQFFLISIILLTILSNQTRTGLMTLVSSLLLTIYVSKKSQKKDTSNKKLPYGIILVLATLLFAAYISLTSIDLPLFDKFKNTFAFLGQNGTLNSGQELGGGTTSARFNSWSFLIENQFSTVALFLFGYGFGTNYMLSSGASFLLLGSSSLDLEFTRNPHSFLLSVFCRLGILGLIFFIFFFVTILKSCVRVLKSGKDPEFSILSITMVTSLFLASQFGVILETPFGAIPFYFFSAIVFMEGKRLNDKTSQK
jgi:O-antigen ligase